MNRITSTSSGVVLCLSAAILAGCRSAQTAFSVAPVTPNAASSVRADAKLRGESLTSTEVRSHCHYLSQPPGTLIGAFRAYGSASGPLPGTFMATGGLRGGLVRNFSERLTIKSGSQEISGSVSYGGVHGAAGCSKRRLSFDFPKLTYKVEPDQHGHASATLSSGSLNESFK
jgi:hypothetical protein